MDIYLILGLVPEVWTYAQKRLQRNERYCASQVSPATFFRAPPLNITGLQNLKREVQCDVVGDVGTETRFCMCFFLAPIICLWKVT